MKQMSRTRNEMANEQNQLSNAEKEKNDFIKFLKELLTYFIDLPYVWDPKHVLFKNELAQFQAFMYLSKKLNIKQTDGNKRIIMSVFENIKFIYQTLERDMETCPFDYTYPEHEENESKPKKRKLSETTAPSLITDSGIQSFSSSDNGKMAFGLTVGHQLGELNYHQRIRAEKLISDIIYQARINKLTTDTTLNI